MHIIESIKEMRAFSGQIKAEGKSIGFVPTMGALHEGHLSLVQRARKENDVTVASVFVNPTQFGPGEDLEKYPRDLEGDRTKLDKAGVDCLFYPSAEAMYPEGTVITISAGRLGTLLCGKSRPGHFDGVVTVVTKLFNIVMPSRAYFGQKDFQQSVIIKKLADDLNIPVEVVVCPIVRERDGLAMSSRNVYLDKRHREAAVVLYRALVHAGGLVSKECVSDASRIIHEMRRLISGEPLAQEDYIAVIDPATLEPLTSISGKAAVCVAVYIGGTRLIDNMIVKVSR